MRVRTLIALLLGVLVAGPARAQEQKGVIDGTILDTQSKTVPGVTVEAKSAAGEIGRAHV